MFLKRLFQPNQLTQREEETHEGKEDSHFLTANLVLNDRYLIERTLSKNIYLSVDLQYERRSVVIKHIKLNSRKTTSLKKYRYHFDREMIEVAKLSESCTIIPKLIDYFSDRESGGNFYIVSEHVEGQNIADELIDLQKIKSELSTVRLLKQILLQLQILHNRDVIHDDIDPTRIIRRASDGQLIFLYYGNLKQRFWDVMNDEIIDDGIHTLINIAFPCSYRSPESLARRASFCTDIYAVGWIGIQSVIDISLWDLPEDVTTGEYQWKKYCNLDDRLIKILTKMTELSVRYRYQNIAEVLEDIDLLV
jgi:eukaryotic-like serine/threonine-protein kinase